MGTGGAVVPSWDLLGMAVSEAAVLLQVHALSGGRAWMGAISGVVLEWKSKVLTSLLVSSGWGGVKAETPGLVEVRTGAVTAADRAKPELCPGEVRGSFPLT